MTPSRSRRRPRPSALRGVAASIVAVALVVGCGTPPSPVPSSSPSASAAPTGVASATAPGSSPTPAASVDNAAVYAQIESDVQAIRELRAKSPVDPKVVDPAQMSKIVSDEVAQGSPPDVVAATEKALKLLGLLPPDASLPELYLTLLTSQVAGLYDPTTKSLYVLSKEGALGPVERVTFAHEFDHALQDQNFGLANLQVDAIGQGDRSLAHLSVAEGDATLVMSLWAQAHLSAADLLALIASSNDPAQVQTLNSMPAILRETLLFPYQTGLAFVTALRGSGGWAAVNAAFANPPASTEQLLHPEKYASHEAVLPVSVPADLAKRLGSGWSVPLSDTLGEFQLRIWLRDVGGLPEAQADAAAAGWGGDRLVLATGPKGEEAVAVLARWDTPRDSAEYVQALLDVSRALQAAGKRADVSTLPDGTVVELVASDAATWARVAKALGLPG